MLHCWCYANRDRRIDLLLLHGRGDRLSRFSADDLALATRGIGACWSRAEGSPCRLFGD
jgi:hypothetical protein